MNGERDKALLAVAKGAHDEKHGARPARAAVAVAGIAIIVQAVALWVMYASASSNLHRETERRLTAIGISSVSYLEDIASRASEPGVIPSSLTRIRGEHGLDDAIIVDSSNSILGDALGRRTGSAASAFDVTPSHVASALKDKSGRAERIALLKNHYTRYYHPVTISGTQKGVLILSIHDSSPSEIRQLQRAMAAGLSASIAVALLIGAVVFLAAAAWRKAVGNMMRMERLAVAGTMAASIAHEIKNPLSIALSAIQVLRKKQGLNDQSLQLLLSSEQEIRRSADHVDGFLDLTRDIAMKLREEDVCECVRDTSKLLNARIEQGGISLVTYIPDHPVIAAIDRGKFRRMLVNLLLNACEALAGRNDGRIDLRIIEPSATGRSIEIVIEDNGPGIPKEALASVFDPFFTTKTNGTGLGMAVARQIVERHGGRLLLDSEEGRGVRAIIEIPTRGSNSHLGGLDEDTYS